MAAAAKLAHCHAAAEVLAASWDYYNTKIVTCAVLQKVRSSPSDDLVNYTGSVPCLYVAVQH